MLMKVLFKQIFHLNYLLPIYNFLTCPSNYIELLSQISVIGKMFAEYHLKTETYLTCMPCRG